MFCQIIYRNKILYVKFFMLVNFLAAVAVVKINVSLSNPNIKLNIVKNIRMKRNCFRLLFLIHYRIFLKKGNINKTFNYIFKYGKEYYTLFFKKYFN